MTISHAGLSQNKALPKKSDTFLFDLNAQNIWRVVNDDVMGGLSKSELIRIDKNKFYTFRGDISLDNNGGFASIRSPQKEYNFRNYKGIEIKFRGDGKIYGITLSEDYRFTGFYYHHSFLTRIDEWSILQIDFNHFLPEYFGKPFEYSRKVDVEDIKEISVVISDKQEGSFKLDIDYIKLIPVDSQSF